MTPLDRPGRRLFLPSAALLLSLVLVACNSATPSASQTPIVPAKPSDSGSPGPSGGPSASQDDAALYQQINAQVQALRGLDEKKPIEPKIVSSDEIGAVLEKSMAEDAPPELLEAYEQLYVGMGLMDAGDSLKDVYTDLLTSQVAGLYDPSSESLYVVSKEGGVGPIEQTYYAHEYDHALQDQHFDLEALQDDLTDQTDTQLARSALAEGDAYVLMTYWLQQNLTPAEMASVFASGDDPEATAILERTPPIVSSQILFPATQGTQFVLQHQMAGTWSAVDEMWANPPDTTEQILHPEKYEAGEAAIPVDLPDDLATRMGDGWTVGLEDTFGEYQIAVWFGLDPKPLAAPDPEASSAAAGWGGDRAVLLNGPDDAWAIAWKTAWDSPEDAAEFTSAAETAIGSAGGPAQVLPGAGGTEAWVVFASSDAVLGQLAGVLGLAG